MSIFTLGQPKDMGPANLIRCIERRIDAYNALINGLAGRPFGWSASQAQWNRGYLAELGITLITKTGAKRKGYELKRGAKPVGKIYFEAPISKSREVYVLESQCNKAIKRQESGE